MRFSKWHALGNSYLLVEEQADADLVQLLCDVRYGIGSDGVLAVDGNEVTIWNPDGSRAEFSGNGTRIAAAWLARRDEADEVTVTVGGRRYPARVRDGLVELDVGAVDVGETQTLELPAECVEVTVVSVGNPHAVLRREPARDDLVRLGPLIEVHPRFPDRTNVQLVRVDGPRELTAVVWERGAGETSASGSSAVAVAAAAVANGWCESPVTVRMPGGSLEVGLDAHGSATLTGPAVEIARGDVFLGRVFLGGGLVGEVP
ncbi:MAG: diaminopimelate epimerase [Actinomycetota bacterium]|nr:diaminopimelate epimerase [Actinomycetota bacterium]